MNKAFTIAHKIVMDAKADVDLSTVDKHNCSLLEKLMIRCGEDSSIPTQMAIDALFGMPLNYNCQIY